MRKDGYRRKGRVWLRDDGETIRVLACHLRPEKGNLYRACGVSYPDAISLREPIHLSLETCLLEPGLGTVSWTADPQQSSRPFADVPAKQSEEETFKQFATWWEKRQRWLQRACQPAQALRILAATFREERTTRHQTKSMPHCFSYPDYLALASAQGLTETAQSCLDELIELHLCRPPERMAAQKSTAPHAALNLCRVLAWAEDTLELRVTREGELLAWLRACVAEDPPFCGQWGLPGAPRVPRLWGADRL